MYQHKWKRDVAVMIVILAILAVVVFVIALAQANWDIGALINQLEAMILANRSHLIVLELILPILGLGAIIGRLFGHFVHKPRDINNLAQIDRLVQSIAEKDRTIVAMDHTVHTQNQLLREFQVHHG